MLPAFVPRRRTAPPPAGARVDWGNPLNANLIGCWLPGAEGVARATNLVNGVLATRATTGVTAAAGLHGQAASFDGTADTHLTCGTLGVYPTSAITLEVLVYLGDALESGAFIKVGSGQQGYAVGVGSGTFDTDGNELVSLREFIGWVASGASMGTGWHHVVSSFHRVNEEVWQHLDGRRVYTAGHSNLNTANTDTFIGGYTGDGSENRHGAYRIALARVYGRQLNDTEVYALASAPFSTLWTPRPTWLGALDAAAPAGGASLVPPPPGRRFSHMVVR